MFNPGTGFTQFYNNGTGESTIQGDLVGNVTGDVTGNITGNTQIGGNATVSGRLSVTGNANIEGSATIGDTSADYHEFRGTVVTNHTNYLQGPTFLNGGVNITDKQITFTGDTSSGVSSTTTRTVKKCILSGTLPSSSPFIIQSAQSGISSSSYVISSELMVLSDSGSPEVWYHFNNGSSSFLSFIRTGVDAGEIQVTFPTFYSGLSFILTVEYY